MKFRSMRFLRPGLLEDASEANAYLHRALTLWPCILLYILLPSSVSHSGQVSPNLGLNVRIGHASNYEPYPSLSVIQFASNAGVRLKVQQGLGLGLGYEFANSSSLCLLSCAEHLRKKSHTLYMDALFRVSYGKDADILIGPSAFLRFGKNAYTLEDKPVDGIDYSGSLVDRYTLLGTGITVSKPIHRYFSLVSTLSYWHEIKKQRENTLYRVDNHGDFRGPVTYELEDRAGYLEFGLGLKAQYDPGF